MLPKTEKKGKKKNCIVWTSQTTRRTERASKEYIGIIEHEHKHNKSIGNRA